MIRGNRITKKIIICVLIVLAILVLGGIIFMILSNPLRRSEERIREDVLQLTPIGLTMEEVIEAIENNSDWANEHEFHDRGVGIRRVGPEGRHGYFATINYTERQRTFVKAIGVQAIRLNIGNYYYPLIRTHVLVHWAFDESGELIDVLVGKEMTSF
ncbi:MAG: hypothetical protein FWC79_06530 [Oscillospiraceae bacterium]|nr:hypothetical protein [Oscillospiraceae bacterium]